MKISKKALISRCEINKQNQRRARDLRQNISIKKDDKGNDHIDDLENYRFKIGRIGDVE